jgi:hypothetical protein
MIWYRYRKGLLLTPTAGLHFQILIFFVIGGFSYVLFPDAEPRFVLDEILESSWLYLLPFLAGYVITCFIEYFYLKQFPSLSIRQLPEYRFSSNSLFFVTFLGFLGCTLEGSIHFAFLGSLLVYLKALFLPCLIFMVINYKRYNILGKSMAISTVLMAVIIGITSPWRSVLIFLLLSLFLALCLTKPKWIPFALLVSITLLLFLIPFQNLKKFEYTRFTVEPMAVLRESLELKLFERWEEVGFFFAVRVNYARELVYVNHAIDSGMLLTNGATYKSLVYQIVPRVFWPAKPELAHWAQFILPREVGLVQFVDPVTSWAVNIFAEACYNFGNYCLIWFVPSFFAFSLGLEQLTQWLLKTREGRYLSGGALFFILLSVTNVIFLSSTIIAVLFISLVFDLNLRESKRKI